MLEVAAQQAQHPARLAVEAAPEADDLVLAGLGPRQPQRRLHRLGAAGEELDAREAVRRERRQQVEEARPRLGREAPEGQPLGLALQRLDVMRVAVADAADADARDEVDVLVAVLVDQRAALPSRHRQPGVEREGLRAGGEVLLLAGDDLARAGPDLAPLAHRASPNRRTR